MSELVTNNKDIPPSEWFKGSTLVPGSEVAGGVYVWHGKDPALDDLHNILIWHWHTPHHDKVATPGENVSDTPHWSAAGVGNHTLVSLDPLHLEASLGCHSGCPNHGWIRGGRWENA